MKTKSSIKLSKLPIKVDGITKEQALELQEITNILLDIKKKEVEIATITQNQIETIYDIYISKYEGVKFDIAFVNTIKHYIKKIGYNEVLCSVQIAIEYISSDEISFIRYFVGVCKNKLNALNNI